MYIKKMDHVITRSFNMNFILGETTFLKYFIPLTIEGNSRDIKSKYFLGRRGKPTDPQRNKKEILKLSKEYNFDVYDISEINNHKGLIFSVEGVDINFIKDDRKLVVLTYMSDFTNLYKTYINRADHVILPNRHFASVYNTLSSKNLYLGSPKYDHVKYEEFGTKNALVMYPKNRDLHKVDLDVVYGWLRELGYRILVKTRPKDPIRIKSHHGDESYCDEYWYPSQSLELMQRSSLVINFGSTSIKEIIMMKRPCINFNTKPYKMQLDFLYDGDHCKNLNCGCTKEEFVDGIDSIDNNYDEVIRKYLFEGNSSKRILDYFEKELKCIM